MLMQLSIRYCFLICLPFCLGCGGDGKLTISGKVTFDGKPIENGEITFNAVDGTTPTASIAITNGVYKLDMMPGNKKVIVTGTKIVGQHPAYKGDPKSPMINDTEQYIPAAYNDQSTLTREIKVSGEQNFDLLANPSSPK